MADTEKITINLSVVDLGRIDLLVEQGFYTTRTDFIRAAIRNQVDKHKLEIQETIGRTSSVIGVLVYDAKDLEKLKANNEHLNINIIGMLVLTKDITPELAREVIQSIKVHGSFKAPDAVQQALSDRMVE
jgi:Arc/MetJ-type ribon-helix-helix transcriptional regulator